MNANITEISLIFDENRIFVQINLIAHAKYNNRRY